MAVEMKIHPLLNTVLVSPGASMDTGLWLILYLIVPN